MPQEDTEKFRKLSFVHTSPAPGPRGLNYLEKLAGAIEKHQVLRITYLPFYEDKPYFNEVHPYLLKEHGQRWYLVGWHQFKEQLRTYALDRIRALEPMKGIAYRDPGFTASEYFKYTLGVIAPAGTPALVKVGVQRTQAQYLITQPWHESQNIQEEEEQEIIFSFRLHPTYEFKSRILSLGKDARILEPLSLKEEIRRELEEMLKAYT